MKSPKELIAFCYKLGKEDAPAYLPMISLSDLHLMRLDLRITEQEDTWLFDQIETEIKNKLS